jgi:hypothetical protein
MQSIGVLMLPKLVNAEYETIREPITKFYTELSNGTLPDCSKSNFIIGFSYILYIVILACLLGSVCHNIVRKLRIDITWPVFRFTNSFNYYFRGDLYSLRSGRKKGKVLSTNIDLIIETGEDKNRMYTGFLAEYTISPISGDLDTIVLSNAERWSESKQSFKEIKGDNFIVPYSKVINMNVRYNIAKRNIKQKISNAIAIVMLLVLCATFILLPYYYYNSIGLGKTIGGIIISIWIWALLVSLFALPFSDKQKDSQGREIPKLKISIVSVVTLCLLSWFLYKIVLY